MTGVLMARAPATVLVDASALRTEHRVRGIGRYVRDMLMGLAATRERWRGELRILALNDLSAEAKAASEDLAAVAEEALALPLQNRATLARARRRALQRAALGIGAGLVHETEVLGVPALAAVPRMATCYDLIPLRYPKHYLPNARAVAMEWLRAWHRYSRARRVVAISARTREEVCQMLRIPADRVDAVPTGIDVAAWTRASQAMTGADVRARFGLDLPFFLYVGGADYRKNPRGMFRAVRIASTRAPLTFAWAGALDDNTLGSVRKLAHDEGVGRLVRFLGYVDDESLACLYREALAQLFLSRLEGFGLPVAEAMACGCPSIVARSSGCDDLVGDAGIVVDADDAEAAASAMLELREAPKRRALAARSTERVAGMTREAMALGYVDAYLRSIRSG